MTRGCIDCGKAIPDRNKSGRCHPCNGRAATHYNRTTALIPDEWKADYHRWVNDMKMPASEARRIITEHVASRGRA